MSQVNSLGIDESSKSGRAAQYVRMSTDFQRYSLENQCWRGHHPLSYSRCYCEIFVI